MVIQSIPFSELSVTEFTSILLNTRMHVHVVLEAGHPVESLATLLTHIGFYICKQYVMMIWSLF